MYLFKSRLVRDFFMQANHHLIITKSKNHFIFQ